MKINRFMANINDVARQNRFEVDLFALSGAIRVRGIRCIAATLPGRTLKLQPHAENQVGPLTPYVTGIDNDGGQIALTFICDDQFTERQAVEAWMQNIYDATYGLNYPERYYGTIQIRQLGRDDLPIYEVELHDVFPSGITAQTLSMESGVPQTLTVNFAYRTWSSSFDNLPSSFLGALFQKSKRRIFSRVRKKIEDKIFKEKRVSLSDRINRKIDDKFFGG